MDFVLMRSHIEAPQTNRWCNGRLSLPGPPDATARREQQCNPASTVPQITNGLAQGMQDGTGRTGDRDNWRPPGLGRKMAEIIARQGAKLALVDLDSVKLNMTAQLCAKAGNQVKDYTTDITYANDSKDPAKNSRQGYLDDSIEAACET